MAFQSGTIDPNSTAPADDIYKIINDLAVLRSVIGGNPDAQVPSSWEPIHANSTLVTSGTAPSYVATTTFALTAYALGVRLRLQFHATLGSGTPTLNVNGLGAKNLRQYNSAGTKVAATIVASQLTEVVYDGTDFVLLAPLPPVAGVTSVAGKTGAVTLTTDDVTEGANLYFTNARAQAAVTSGFSNMVAFTTPGTTSWTVPAGVTQAKVTVIGGGGGGAGSSNGSGGGGGGGGGAVIKILTGLVGGVVGGNQSTLSITVGSGGAAGTTTPGAGGSGGTSSVASGTNNTISTISATGGAGGPTSGGAGGVGSAGDLNIAGSGGGGGIGGVGGSSIFGGGAPGKGNTGAGGAGQAYGGGGGGGFSTSSITPVTGGAGSSGVVIIEY